MDGEQLRIEKSAQDSMNMREIRHPDDDEPSRFRQLSMSAHHEFVVIEVFDKTSG